MKKNHSRKIIAAISATVLFIMFFACYIIFPALFMINDDVPLFFPLIPMIIGAGFIVCIIIALRERIKEVKSGQEDDLDKY